MRARNRGHDGEFVAPVVLEQPERRAWPAQRGIQLGQHDVARDAEQRRDMTAGVLQHDARLVHLTPNHEHVGLPELESHRQAGI